MKILQVNKFYSPTIGGIERVVQNISEDLSDTFKMQVLAAQPYGRARSEVHNGIYVKKALTLGVWRSVPISPTFPLEYRFTASEVDVVHHHLPNPLSVAGHLLTSLNDTPTVVTYHSDIVRQKMELKIYKPFLLRFLNQIDKIIVTSDRLLDHSDFLSPYKHKCAVVPLSVDYRLIREEDTSVEFDLKDPIVLFVGRLNYYKGVEYLISSMDDVDATLLIVGDGERRSSLEQLTLEKGVKNKINFLGQVSEERLPKIYRSADVFVLPSVASSEAFGIVQLEAMARGVPVVNTNLPTGVPWVSQDSKTGLTVPPRNPDALADAINRLLQNDDLRTKYAEQAEARVANMFTRERMLDKIEEIYKSVVNNRG